MASAGIAKRWNGPWLWLEQLERNVEPSFGQGPLMAGTVLLAGTRCWIGRGLPGSSLTVNERGSSPLVLPIKGANDRDVASFPREA